MLRRHSGGCYFGDAARGNSWRGAVPGVSMSIFVGAVIVALALTVSFLAGRGCHGGYIAWSIGTFCTFESAGCCVVLYPGIRIDLMAYLFGDILAQHRAVTLR
jgi:zinc transport system permease protein